MMFYQFRGGDARVLKYLAWITLLTFCLFVGARFSENITLIQAWGGWSPIDWVAHQVQPENFKSDFSSGIAAYQMSSFMQLYVLLGKNGVDIAALVPWVIRFEAVFLGFAAAVLFRTLVPQASGVAMTIFAMLIVEGSVRDMDLARFSGGFYQGLFYNIVDGLSLLGLAAIFKGRIIVAALLLGLGFTVHPSMAGMACLFVTPYVLLSFRRFSFSHWLIAATIFLAIMGAWIAHKILLAEVTSGLIPSDQWLGLVRMFSYHWFPLDIGVFTRLHERYILPLLCLIALAILYLPIVIKGRLERTGIALGICLLVVLAFTGVLFSEFSTEPLLIKLALHRASSMLILVSLLIVVAGLTCEIFNGKVLEAALGGALLFSPLLMSGSVAFPVFATIAFLAIHAVRAYVDKRIEVFYLSLISLIILFIVVTIYYFIGISKISEYLAWPNFWIVVLIFLCTAIIRCVYESRSSRSLCISLILSSFLLGALMYLSINSIERKTLISNEQKELASDYMQAQYWARANTAPSSLFMIDPTMSYGWRDFSRRSSFGSLREWLHTGWLYDSQLAVYKEGLKRFDEFGIDIEPYKNIRPSIEGYHKLSNDLRRDFYLKDRDWFKGISRRYGVEYLVLRKKFETQNLQFEEVFHNDHFSVYRLTQ
jgi:hypothetical protein